MNKIVLEKEKELTVSNISGFSMIELLLVLTLMLIMSGVTFYYLNTAKTLYRADEAALKISDILQEARQRSLTQRVTMRVEIDLTDNVIRLINENSGTKVGDDVEIKSAPLSPSSEVRLDERPDQIHYNPPEEFPVPSAKFKQSIYPNSLAHNVNTIRFLSDGTVVDQGTNGKGKGAVVTGVSLHVWSPQKDDINNAKIARSITIIGSTGSIRLWEYDHKLTGANKWKDSRRTSVFGGDASGEDSSS